jgi:hypothetical protein
MELFDASMEYQTNEAIFTLPESLRDKTVHMFVLNEERPNEFSVVVSRSSVPAAETLDEHMQRLKAELSATLPKFQLMDMIDRQYDGCPAAELQYRWSNNGMPMYQRQSVSLIKSSIANHHAALMITATCPRPFSEEWDQAFNELLDSVRIRDSHRLSMTESADELPAVLADEEVQEDYAPINSSYIFALAIRDRVLHVYDDEEQACRRVNALEAEDGLWSFFNSQGQPLQAEFIEPNTGKIWRSAGKYRLRRPSLQNIASLDACIDEIVKVVGNHPLNSIAAVRLHLERQTGASSADIDARL